MGFTYLEIVWVVGQSGWQDATAHPMEGLTNRLYQGPNQLASFELHLQHFSDGGWGPRLRSTFAGAHAVASHHRSRSCDGNASPTFDKEYISYNSKFSQLPNITNSSTPPQHHTVNVRRPAPLICLPWTPSHAPLPASFEPGKSARCFSRHELLGDRRRWRSGDYTRCDASREHGC